MVAEVYIPFCRDFIDYVKEITGTEELGSETPPNLDMTSRRVFVVHGHDDGTREAVARFLEAVDFEPIILHEKPNQGRTIIEKIESYGNVGFAIVILTPDDVGASAKNPEALSPRARQNVIAELGYFVGRLGRARVVALKQGDIEIPSDFDGVVYIPCDSGNGWRLDLGKEFQAAGYDLDWNKIMGSR